MSSQFRGSVGCEFSWSANVPRLEDRETRATRDDVPRPHSLPGRDHRLRTPARGPAFPPLIVLLRGDLGAGKTTLVKGIAEGFQAASAQDVTSPTFTLVHEYRGPRATLYHIDLYRIDTERELETLGLDDLLAPDSILLIEWGEKFPRFVRARNVEVVLERVGEDDRRVIAF